MDDFCDVNSDISASTVLLSEDSSWCEYRTEKGLRVGVVGAGPAGLCAAKHFATAPGDVHVVVFEQADSLGGTWLYTENTSRDKYGLPVQSSMYKDLRTNLPKECMAYPDFPYEEQKRSYLDAPLVLQYLNSYTDNFNIRHLIKVNHHVKKIAPLGTGWSLTAEDLQNRHEQVYYFDAIMICNGPNSIPVYPQVEGMAKFSGQQLHSRAFRDVEQFRDKTVLVIGLGPSGMDITLLLSRVSRQVFLSHNRKMYEGSRFPENVIIKPNVDALNDKQAHFVDNTVEEVEVVIYCTGYTYHYPFLSEDCGIVVDQYVSPLYKHMINIEHPTMCVIGLPKLCPHMYMVDFQVRCFLKVMSGEVKLPPKEDMLQDLENDIAKRKADKQRKKDYHKLWRDRTDKYFADLADLGRLEPVPPVQVKMFSNAFVRALKDFQHFRDATYRVLDDENFEVTEFNS